MDKHVANIHIIDTFYSGSERTEKKGGKKKRSSYLGRFLFNTLKIYGNIFLTSKLGHSTSARWAHRRGGDARLKSPIKIAGSTLLARLRSNFKTFHFIPQEFLCPLPPSPRWIARWPPLARLILKAALKNS
ncbi:hypothetical protein EVAR_79459_1 [Eumeta japonica]|uniref:Uncharacterized protein n=1 Tax=Eumeta variegata TaxID=151549 RepID=A0A4C1UDM5_EUMVA|nr:hypothetical protein EVAR_79459_1 [Eumeta japonica]